MILPLGHDGMTMRRMPWMTIFIIFANYIVFVSTAHDPAHFRLWGFIPASPTPWGLVTSMFIHAGWMHFLGNMYFLYLCGCTIEDLWGRPLFVAVYFLGGFASTSLHCYFNPDSTAALVGASGAISAIMGVFFIRCFETELRCLWLDFPIVTTFKVRAGWILFLWFAEQLLFAVLFARFLNIAFWSHIGGFAFGATTAALLSLTGLERSVVAPAVERKLNLVRIHPRLERALAHIDRRDYLAATRDLKIATRDYPEDPDLCQLLAQCYAFLGRPRDARLWLYRELRIHLKQRNRPMIVEAYFELLASGKEMVFQAKDVRILASALRAEGYPKHAADVTRELVHPGPVRRIRNASV